MWIGTGRIVLDFYNNEEVRIKKRNIDELCKDLRRQYNLSALEVADEDDPERCVIGFAAVMPESWREQSAKALTQKIAETIDQTAFARMTVENLQLFSHE